MSRPQRFGASTVVAVALFLGIAAAFSPVAFNDFVNYDDPDMLTENPMVNQGLSLRGLRWAFTVSEQPNWHPLTWISHMVDFQLFGADPMGHHLVSLLVHAAAAVALLLVLRAATGALLPSALVAAAFGLHPLRVESVAWAAERKDVLTVLLGVLAIGAYLRFVRRRSAAAGAVAVAAYACALMAKPLLVTFPFLLLLLDAWPLGRWGKGRGAAAASPARALLLEKVPYLVLAAGVGVVTVIAQRGGGAVAYAADYPLAPRFANAARSAALYLAKTFVPAKLAVFYPYAWRDVAWWEPALGAAVVAAASAAAVVLARRVPAYAVGWGWYLVALAPVIGIVQAGSQSMADRYTSVPHVGLLVALVWAVRGHLARNPALRALAAPAAATLLLALAAATARQATLWRTSETLFRHAIAVTTDNYVAYSNLGNALAHAGRADEGRRFIELALRTNPAFRGEALMRGAAEFERLGRHGEAAAQYRKALAIAPHDTRIAAKLRAAEQAAGGAARGTDGAAVDPHAALAPPRAAVEAYDRGNALVQQGRIEEAAAAYREAARLAPGSVDAWINLGVALGQLGRLDEAEQALLEALRIAPGSELGAGNLAAIRALRGRPRTGKAQGPAGR